MELDPIWMLLGLPLAFALGWLASRMDLRQLKLENGATPKAYLRGLNFLLNEQQDDAIDAFIEAAQKDPETSELHFALGNLFRRRGEYERAIRVHEHLLSRGDLNHQEHQRAQYALALDFMKAGLIDHAENAFHKLQGSSHQEQAWLGLLSLYERTRDWPQATQIARQLQQSGRADFSPRLTHYMCEQAAELMKKAGQDLSGGKQDDTVIRILQSAIESNPAAARPRIELAGYLADNGQLDPALDALLELQQHAPHMIPLVASEMVRLGKTCQRLPAIMAFLQKASARNPSIDVSDALAQASALESENPQQARAIYIHHMEQEASLIAASRWFHHFRTDTQAEHQTVQNSIDHAAVPLMRYRCAACGFETQGYFWQCPGCQAWESFPPKRIEEL